MTNWWDMLRKIDPKRLSEQFLDLRDLALNLARFRLTYTTKDFCRKLICSRFLSHYFTAVRLVMQRGMDQTRCIGHIDFETDTLSLIWRRRLLFIEVYGER